MEECEAELEGHSGIVNSAVFSSDGMHIVSASWDETVRVWYIDTEVCLAVLIGHRDSVHSAIFTPDGMHIISASRNNAKIWNAVTGECEAELNPPYMSENTQLSVTSVFIQNHWNGDICLSHQLSFLNIHEDTIFHTKNLQKLSIPPFFSMPVCISHHLSKICLGYASGDILKVCIPKSYSTLLPHSYYFECSSWINIVKYNLNDYSIRYHVIILLLLNSCSLLFYSVISHILFLFLAFFWCFI